MPSFLKFSNNTVEGFGTDDIGQFTWRGHYDKEAMTCRMTKSYATHQVYYSGRVDENGIWGEWQIGTHFKGGFHLWPASDHQEGEAEEKITIEEPSDFHSDILKILNFFPGS